ncbi:hypothetical protein [Cohnella thailandensis]|uniref:Uncharacterized protein n=1 Tax=Cohnella thailandensis TaxID=557557 RepID=A0A841T635_9BACL|nr:hypothetical protein [Cohnella thailandensis]MBB6637768.1 hypothetical protein [Cohnella thailandensis]MBP1974055.1 hypothetical protein [Cohnella thailandensis]
MSYLEQHYPKDAERISEYLMFMDNEEGMYLYKNRLSRAQIAFDPEGELLYCQESALQYRYSWSPGMEEEVCAAREELAVHENVTRWIERSLSPRMKATYGEDLKLFLQELWGPLTEYRFEELKADSPVRSLSANGSLYLYSDQAPNRLAFEFLPAPIAEARKQEELRRRRELLSGNGWTVISFTREALDRHLPLLRERLQLEWKKRQRFKRSSEDQG